MKLRANSSQPCLESPAVRHLRRSNDALPAAQARSRFVSTGRSVHFSLPLHGIGPGYVLRRNASEPADRAGDGGGAACPIRFRQAASSSLRVLAKVRTSCPDGILIRLYHP